VVALRGTETVERGGIRVRAVDSGVSVSAGPVWVESDATLERSRGVFLDGSTGSGSEFCILHVPSKNVPEECPPGRTFDTSRDGAVWVTSNGRSHSLGTQREIYSVGGLVP
jgi:hypothetical protein